MCPCLFLQKELQRVKSFFHRPRAEFSPVLLVFTLGVLPRPWQCFSEARLQRCAAVVFQPKTYQTGAVSPARSQLRLHFSEECFAREWTVTAHTILLSEVGVVEALGVGRRTRRVQRHVTN